MYDDVSAIPTTGCNYLSSSSVIYNYYQNTRRTFVNIGGRWVQTATQSYTSIPTGYSCIDVTTLSSNSNMLPIYYFIAFVLAVFVWFLWWFVFRRLFKWRIR